MRALEEIKAMPNLIVKKISSDGGAGEIQYGRLKGSVIWSFGGGWDHVSVMPYKRGYTPSWSEMCRVKDMFFQDDETVVQYHPAKADYVDNVSNCLHLWRPQKEELPTPPAIFVGIKGVKLR